jgi:hypothetical protein
MGVRASAPLKWITPEPLVLPTIRLGAPTIALTIGSSWSTESFNWRPFQRHESCTKSCVALAQLEQTCLDLPLVCPQEGKPMLLTKVLVRFYRSFNFDHEYKSDPRSAVREWETIPDEGWFPFVEVDIDDVITAVVGANESGKSHLIGATKRGLTGLQIDSSDFCRYSKLYSVETGKIRVPDFGVELQVETDAEVSAMRGAGVGVRVGGYFTLLRRPDGSADILTERDTITYVAPPDVTAINAILPRPFELRTDARIPDTISFDVLLEREPSLFSDRQQRFALDETLRARGVRTVVDFVTSIANVGSDLDTDLALSELESAEHVRSQALGRDLLVKVARIAPEKFAELEKAIRDGHEGQVGALIEQMNRSLARHLNFRKWWRQDQDFQLRLAPRERELAFTIRDKTGTDYSFSERSRGLTYFLGYYVQLRAHRRQDGRSEVLLMDEPDAYLSSAAQNDLLRVLEDFARPSDATRRDQVMYVTHSPFLINKNAGHRIRVLDKGNDQEGTRVVKDIVQNHYEPLRSSIGAHVAETAFIGGTNLLVEGPTDQILLTGALNLLRRRSVPASQLIDLNQVTVVPCASASHVPYMAYLARGRDSLKPACVALLDDDDAGREAIRKLRKSSASGKRILSDEFIINIGEWAAESDLDLPNGIKVAEPEDLIPPALAVEACRLYAARFLGAPTDQLDQLKAKDILELIAEANGHMWAAVEMAFVGAFEDAHIEKVGFNKELVHYLERVADMSPRPAGLLAFEKNFAALIDHLTETLRVAGDSEEDTRQIDRVARVISGFLKDNVTGASRDEGNQALRDIEGALDDSDEHDAIQAGVSAMRRRFKLSTDPLTAIIDFERFCEELQGLLLLPQLMYRETLGTQQGRVS